MRPYYDEGGIVIYHGDCREVLPIMSDVSLIATDPPYCNAIDEEWDRQWASDADFLSWLDDIVGQLEQAATDNATFYFFTSPRLAARVEVKVAERLRIINSAVWDKGACVNSAGSGIDVTALRAYWPANTERVIVAEKSVNGSYSAADRSARDACGYWGKCEEAKRSVIGDYLRAEFKRAGVTNKKVAALFPSRTGGMTGCVSNWLLGLNVPTPEQYEAMRQFLNARGGEYLRKDYEELRKDYEELRKDYEELRRPFFLTSRDQWGEVWRFALDRKKRHPTQKPLSLMSQIVRVSSRPGDLILDPFCGSGTTLVAAKNLGRRAIGIEIEEKYCEIAVKRLAQGVLPL